MTQVDRLIAYLHAHPGATAMQLVTELRMPKYTSRISDARQRGVVIECRKVDGIARYFVNAPPAPLRGEQEAAWPL